LRTRNRLRKYFDAVAKSRWAKLIIGAITILAASIIPIYNFFFPAKHPPELSDLRCEAVAENGTVQVARPLFTWQFHDEDSGDRQDSVYIKVGTGAGEAAMWEHGFAGPQNQIRYAGKILANNRMYNWSLQVTDNKGLRSQVQHGTFKTAWQEHDVAPFVSIQHQEKIDGYILQQYLQSLESIALAYRDANAGAACSYRLVFRESQPGLFELNISMQSAANAALACSDTVAAKEAEPALLSLLERAYKNLQAQLENYNSRNQ